MLRQYARLDHAWRVSKEEQTKEKEFIFFCIFYFNILLVYGVSVKGSVLGNEENI